jgi:two-component system LytT family response regulator
MRAGVASLLETLRERGRRGPEMLVLREVRTGTYRLVRKREIEWVQAHQKRARVHIGKETLLWGTTLAEAEQRLGAPAFLRVHRSSIVNRARIRTVRLLWKGAYLLTLESGKSLVTGKGYRRAVEKLLSQARQVSRGVHGKGVGDDP